MRQAWRWFGPQDGVRIDDIIFTGAEEIVSALHHVPDGAVWRPEDISQRQAEVGRRRNGTPSSLEWTVVESLPVSEAIKQQKGEWRDHIDNYKISLANLAAAGITTVCYNFMPVIDWTRTDLAFPLPNGATCMRYDAVDFAVFDLYLLARPGAKADYGDTVREAARQRFMTLSDARKSDIAASVLAGLPGAADQLSVEKAQAHLDQYANISAERLRRHFLDFLEEVVPVASELGQRLCCHPDDPPFALMGLPRIMSTEEDCRAILTAVDDPANGITLCSGSLGARADNDLPGMMRRLGSRVHFLHLRNVRRETETFGGSFHESEHLDGSVDMGALIAAILEEESRRCEAGRSDWAIPMRPDHGLSILSDIGSAVQPGYPLIGRLKALAELRGVSHGLAAAGR
tara:strand:+ start:26797 stop:28002 length:1206 start_codon:yes stop_codon:yes gene_type:complete